MQIQGYVERTNPEIYFFFKVGLYHKYLIHLEHTITTDLHVLLEIIFFRHNLKAAQRAFFHQCTKIQTTNIEMAARFCPNRCVFSTRQSNLDTFSPFDVL